MKEVVAVIAVLLTFFGYVPYIRDTLKGKTTPHTYSWLIWGVVTLLAYALQVSAHAGAGSLVTLAAGIICLGIALLGFGPSRQYKHLDAVDTFCFGLALVATLLWLLAKQRVTAVIFLSLADMIGFVPTIRKSWRQPYQETLFSYEMNTFRFVLAIYALRSYNIVALLYPLTWVVANGLFSLYLVVRRHQLPAARPS